MAVNFNISDEELKMQIALGTADLKYLNPDFILSRRNPETIAALTKLWSRAPLTKTEILHIADTLISHPCIQKTDREFMIHTRNIYLDMYKRIQKTLETLKHSGPPCSTYNKHRHN